MKLTIIASKYPFFGRVPLVPPILEYLAALTCRELPEADITLVDANHKIYLLMRLSRELAD